MVSGASSGIGKEVSLLYAKRGVNLVLSARRVDKLSDVSTECASVGSGETLVVPCDVSKEEDCKNLIQKAISEFGRIDTLVLNAGVGQSFFLETMTEEANPYQYMDINYYGCIHPTIAALPHLQKTSGRIVVVSSLGGLLPFPRQTLYNASKFALMGFYESLRMELQSKKSGVSISMICPGFVETELTQGRGLGRDGKPIGIDGTKKIKMMKASECAANIVEAADNRVRMLITPKWGVLVWHLRNIFPSLVDALLIKMYAGSPKKKKEL